jgi:hypothetical protein
MNYICIYILHRIWLFSMMITLQKSRDHLTSPATVFLIWWYFVRRHYFQVFYVVLCPFLYLFGWIYNYTEEPVQYKLYGWISSFIITNVCEVSCHIQRVTCFLLHLCFPQWGRTFIQLNDKLCFILWTEMSKQMEN